MIGQHYMHRLMWPVICFERSLHSAALLLPARDIATILRKD